MLGGASGTERDLSGFRQDGLGVSESLCSSLGVIFVSLPNVATLNSHYFSDFHYSFNWPIEDKC